MKLRIACVQPSVGREFEDNISSAENLLEEGYEKGINLFLLPEYFSYPEPDFILYSRETIRIIKKWSQIFDSIVAGNAVIDENGEMYNILKVYYRGDLVGEQKKLHPTRIERDYGIKSGNRLEVFRVNGVNLGALICADILYPEICRVAGIKGVDLILNPVVSFRESDFPPRKYKECLYFTRSFDNGYFIAKAGGVGSSPCGDEIAGRSLISSPHGIMKKARSELEPELVWIDIDIEAVRTFREENYSLRDRNVEAYRDLV